MVQDDGNSKNSGGGEQKVLVGTLNDIHVAADEMIRPCADILLLAVESKDSSFAESIRYLMSDVIARVRIVEQSTAEAQRIVCGTAPAQSRPESPEDAAAEWIQQVRHVLGRLGGELRTSSWLGDAPPKVNGAERRRLRREERERFLDYCAELGDVLSALESALRLDTRAFRRDR